jgi:hypothetical protein
MTPALLGYAVETDFALPRARGGPTGRGTLTIAPATESILEREGELATLLDDPRAGTAVAIDGDRLVVWCSASGNYLLDPREGRVDVEPAGDADVWEHRLGSAMLPLLLSERGDLALHAAAIEEDGGAVLACGQSGNGKSTFAAARATAGRTILAEDGTVVDKVDGSPRVWPGLAGIRVSPAAVEAMGGTWPDSERARDGRDRGLVLAEAEDPRDAIAVRAVVILGERGGRDVEITPVAPTAAVPVLVYSSMFAGPTRIEAALRRLASLVERVPVYRVRMPDDLSLAADAAAEVAARVTG